jgi:hypothetical protein
MEKKSVSVSVHGVDNILHPKNTERGALKKPQPADNRQLFFKAKKNEPQNLPIYL